MLNATIFVSLAVIGRRMKAQQEAAKIAREKAHQEQIRNAMKDFLASQDEARDLITEMRAFPFPPVTAGPYKVNPRIVQRDPHQVSREISHLFKASGPKSVPKVTINNYTPTTITMYLVDYDPAFEKNSKGQIPDPVQETTTKLMESVSVTLDSFIRECIGKVLDPFSLSLFVDTKAPIPMLDIEVYFISQLERTVKIYYKRQEIGMTKVISKIDKKENGDVVVATTLTK